MDDDQAAQELPAARHLQSAGIHQSKHRRPGAPQPPTPPPEVQLGRAPRHKRFIALTLLFCAITAIPALSAALILSYV